MGVDRVRHLGRGSGSVKRTVGGEDLALSLDADEFETVGLECRVGFGLDADSDDAWDALLVDERADADVSVLLVLLLLLSLLVLVDS